MGGAPSTKIGSDDVMLQLEDLRRRLERAVADLEDRVVDLTDNDEGRDERHA